MTNNITPIFLFSMPRSGSTLCQRIIATNPKIATSAEPTILLPLLHLMKDRDVYSKYDHHFTVWAIQDFCQNLPNGEKDYSLLVRDFVLQLYERMADDRAHYFLDKTPKYHLIVDDIMQMFPESKAIFLWRNPLSIIASLMKTWGGGGGKWNLHHFRMDLYEGLPNLVAAYGKYENRAMAVRFEDLVQEPQKFWPQVFSYLGEPFDPASLTEFSKVTMDGRVQDPNVSQHEYHTLRQDRVNGWQPILGNPLRKNWCKSYLAWLGPERLAIMGYNIAELEKELVEEPFTTNFLLSDIFRMPYDLIYRLFELRIMKQKVRDLRAGKHIYAHK